MEPEAHLVIFPQHTGFDRCGPKMRFDQHVRDPRLFPLALEGREYPISRFGERGRVLPCLHELGKQRMERHRSVRSFAFRYSDLATRPGTANVNLRLLEIHVMPLQAQAFRDTKTCGRSQQGQSALWLVQMHENIKGLLWSQNHRLVAAGRLAANETHGVCFLSSGNQPMALPVLEDQTHHPSYLVECGICEIFLLLQSLQPLFYL